MLAAGHRVDGDADLGQGFFHVDGAKRQAHGRNHARFRHDDVVAGRCHDQAAIVEHVDQGGDFLGSGRAAFGADDRDQFFGGGEIGREAPGKIEEDFLFGRGQGLTEERGGLIQRQVRRPEQRGRRAQRQRTTELHRDRAFLGGDQRAADQGE